MNFKTIYNTYWSKVYRQCMGYVNDTDTAKDLAQETFIKVWENLPKFRNESSIGTWIFRIAVNTCLGHIRKGKKIQKSPLPSEIPQEASTNIEPQVRFLYSCISELPEIERLIISLELEDVDQREIAKIVGISDSYVRVKIHRIKKKLTKKFKDNGR